MLKEMATELATPTGTTIGTDLFVGSVPADATDTVTLLIDNGGSATWDNDNEQSAFQVITRAKDSMTAYELGRTFHEAIKVLIGVSLPVVDSANILIQTIQAVSTPGPIGRDEKGRYEYSANYIVRMDRSGG